MVRDPLRIMMIDDNADDFVILRAAFDEAGVSGICLSASAHMGDEALTLLRRPEEDVLNPKRPQMILLDINLPKKNGFEILEEIKADPELRHLAVIMFTSSVREDDIARAYLAGACSYIVKPVEFSDLVTIVLQLEAYWTLVSRLPRQQEITSRY